MNGHRETLLIGVDFGTTNIKAIAFDAAGRAVARASVPTPTRTPQPGRAYYEPEELWQRTLSALRQTAEKLDDPRRVAALAFSSLGETAVPLDAHDEPTYHAIAWFDSRTKPQGQWLEETIGRDRLFAVTGLSLSPIFGLCKLLWMQQEQPDAFARTVRWLNVADYLAYRMSGTPATDYSLASRMLALDLRTRRWADDLLADAGVNAERFAPLASSGTDLGPLLPDVARAIGLPETVRVGVGGHDHVCGAFAAGIVQPGTALNSMGTSEVMFTPLDAPLTAEELGRTGYQVGMHVDGQHYYVWGSIPTSGACVDWFRSLLAPGADYATLIAEGEQAPAGSRGVCFLPHLRSAMTPHPDAQSLGAFIGLTTDIDRSAMFRAVLEGVAFEIRDGLDVLRRYLPAPISRIVAIGGGTRNRLLVQIKASVLNQCIEVVDMEEAVALGAAMLGGIAAGVYRSPADAMGHVRFSGTTIEPDEGQRAVYDTVFRRVYQRTYPTLRDLNHAIYSLRDQLL